MIASMNPPPYTLAYLAHAIMVYSGQHKKPNVKC